MRLVNRLRALLLSTALLNTTAPILCWAQSGPSAGERIYALAADSVFLVEAKQADGSTSLGSAFLVAPQKLVTNAHVIRGSQPYLHIGPARIECQVISSDETSDLALLRPGSTISARPLPLANVMPAIGSTIYAIGNPAGLERTITQGLYTGRRISSNNREVLQISAAISPGSSGSPVFNGDGEVIGIVVSFLPEGQNLNFAVPSSVLARLLAHSSLTIPSGDESLKEIDQLADNLSGLTFSTDKSSPWQLSRSKISTLFSQALSSSNNPDLLLRIARRASSLSFFEVTIDAARRALEDSRKPLPEAHALLASGLLQRALFDPDTKERRLILEEAQKHAEKAIALQPHPAAQDLVTLAWIVDEFPDQKTTAYSYLKRALAVARSSGNGDLSSYFRDLAIVSAELGRSVEAIDWSRQVLASDSASQYDWQRLANLLTSTSRYGEAAEAWISAASVGFQEGWCEAARGYYFASKKDETLAAARKCIENASKVEKPELVALAHRLVSSTLLERGVYDQAIVEAREAIALDSRDAWTFFDLAKGLEATGRDSEAVEAAQNALRLSDGRFSTMHFVLGTAYFKLANWDQAQRAFEKAAELEPKDDAATYNVAICLQRQGFFSDAATWYEETLRRRPDHPERDEIRRRISVLRKH